MISAYDLKEIAKAGSNLIIDASNYSAYDLKETAKAAKTANCSIVLKNVGKLSGYELKSIAKENPGNITFELTN